MISKLKNLKFVFLVIFAFGGLVLLQRSFAAGGQLCITTGSTCVASSSASVDNGNNVTLRMRINPGQNVDDVRATVTYDQSKLQFIPPVDYSSSPFDFQAGENISSGSITVDRFRASSGYVSTDSLIGQLTFKALTGSGSTTVTISGYAALNGSQISEANGSATVNFTTPPPVDHTPPTVSIDSPLNGNQVSSPATVKVSASDASGIQKVVLYLDGNQVSTQSGSSPYNFSVSLSSGKHTIKVTAYDNATAHNSASSTIFVSGPNAPTSPGNPHPTPSPEGNSHTPSPTPKPSTPTTPPQQIGSVTSKVDLVQFTTANFTLTSTKPFSAYIEYGLNGQLDFQTSPTPFATSQTIGLDSKLLLPGQIYTYRVVTIDASGKKTSGDLQTFKTKGYTINVRILDANQKPVRKHDVTLFSDPIRSQTDGNGIAQFSDVTPGIHHVEYDAGGKKYQKEIQVANNFTTGADGTQSAATQNIAVIYDNLQQGNSVVKIAVGAGIAAVVIGVTVAILWLQKSRGSGGGHGQFGPVTVGGTDSPKDTDSTLEQSVIKPTTSSNEEQSSDSDNVIKPTSETQ